MLSLITAVIENVRVITSESYITMASDSAVEMLFGDYNRELYEEYHLFGYGGFNGIGVADFEAELEEIIKKNMQYKPENDIKSYSNLYRLKDISCEVSDYNTLDEDKVFIEQISDYMVTSIVENVKDYVTNSDGKYKGGSSSGMLDEALKYENGEYDNINSDDANQQNNKVSDSKSDKPTEAEIDEQLEKDDAGGNPLSALKNLINDGLLSLVCDVSEVSENKIVTDEEDNGFNEENNNSSAAAFFKSLLESDESTELNQDELLKEADSGSNMDKLKYIYYAQDVLSSYIDCEYKTVHYGLEYLIAGKKSEKENLASIVRKLLIIRTLVNMVYVSTNASFQSKSFATATALVGFTGLVPVITGVQWTILMILAFEEACIDVTALLEGKKVPLIKSHVNFKMKYGEICMASSSFFKRKANGYPKADNGKISADISYKQYLLLLQLTVSKGKLKERIIDIIEFDLRERFNQTFEFSDCICRAECYVNYNIPYTYSYIKRNLFDKIQTKDSERYVTVSYGYVDNV